MSPEQIQEKHSERVFWVIQTVFSFLLASSLKDYKDVFLDPSSSNWVILIAILVVYTTTLWSWIDFSYTSIASPYDFKGDLLEQCRFFCDLGIVALYGYLLFMVDEFRDPQKANVGSLLWGLALVFFLYLVSGLLRRFKYGPRASRLWLIGLFFPAYCILAACYYLIWNGGHFVDGESYNLTFLTTALALMLAYRFFRHRFAHKRQLWIAIDVDGVLANQVQSLIPIINNRYGLDWRYEDVTEWNPKISNTDLVSLIKEQQGHKNYIAKMPVMPSAAATMRRLFEKFRVAVVTSRPHELDKGCNRSPASLCGGVGNLG